MRRKISTDIPASISWLLRAALVPPAAPSDSLTHQAPPGQESVLHSSTSFSTFPPPSHLQDLSLHLHSNGHSHIPLIGQKLLTPPIFAPDLPSCPPTNLSRTFQPQISPCLSMQKSPISSRTLEIVQCSVAEWLPQVHRSSPACLGHTAAPSRAQPSSLDCSILLLLPGKCIFLPPSWLHSELSSVGPNHHQRMVLLESNLGEKRRRERISFIYQKW